MSTIGVSSIEGIGGAPVSFPDGITIGKGTGVGSIGTPGQAGFGKSVFGKPLELGRQPMSDHDDPLSPNYGDYLLPDGSVQGCVAVHFVKYGTGSNGLALNRISIKEFTEFDSVAEANAAGYFVPRAFYNAGSLQPYVWRDKYVPSNNNGVASSLKNGKPLSAHADHNPFSGLSGAPANAIYGAIAAAKTRGSSFFPSTLFIEHMLHDLQVAHAQAATDKTFCAWYDKNGVTNFPKGCNNNALGDSNDSLIKYESDGYSNCGKTGSANLFARTTHNGQECGFPDVNGLIWRFSPGITSDGTNFYILKTSVDMAAVTAGNTLATDLWGAAGIAAMYDSLGPTYEALTASSTNKTMGNATNPVFSGATSGLAWAAAGAGIPLATGVGGSNLYGNDYFYDARPNELAPIVAADWDNGASAGPGARDFGTSRGSSVGNVSFVCASYR